MASGILLAGVTDFLNYSPGLASDILAERKSGKILFTHFFLIVSPDSHYTLACQSLNW